MAEREDTFREPSALPHAGGSTRQGREEQGNVEVNRYGQVEEKK